MSPKCMKTCTLDPAGGAHSADHWWQGSLLLAFQELIPALGPLSLNLTIDRSENFLLQALSTHYITFTS